MFHPTNLASMLQPRSVHVVVDAQLAGRGLLASSLGCCLDRQRFQVRRVHYYVKSPYAYVVVIEIYNNSG